MQSGERSTVSKTLTVRVKVFGQYAEVLGSDSFTFHLPEPATVADAVASLRSRVANGGLLPKHPMVALNLEHVHADRSLQDGDEIALLPPVAGG